MGNVPPHFDDAAHASSANAQRERNFEVNRTNPFCCAVSPSFIARSTMGRHGDRRKKITDETLGPPAIRPSVEVPSRAGSTRRSTSCLLRLLERHLHGFVRIGTRGYFTRARQLSRSKVSASRDGHHKKFPNKSTAPQVRRFSPSESPILSHDSPFGEKTRRTGIGLLP